MSKGRTFRGLVVIGGLFLLSAPVWGQVSTSALEDMSNGDGGSDYDISSGFFGFGTSLPNPTSFAEAVIQFTAGTGTTGVSLTGDSVTILYSFGQFGGTNNPLNSDTPPTANKSGADAFTTCNVIGTVTFAAGLNTVTCTLDTPFFMQNVTTDADSAYYAVFSLGGTGTLVTDASAKATLEFLPAATAVPEPGTIGACLLGLTGLGIFQRRLKRQS